MRVRADTELLDLVPGQRADITLDVINTGQVIDGVTARIVGLPDQHVSSHPSVLPLFPDSSGQMTLTLGLPRSFPAGRHPMTVEVHSRQPGTAPAYVDVDLLVPQAPAIGLSSSPQLIRTHRNARYILTVANRGNVALDVALKANDPEKAISVALTPSRLMVPAGQAGDVVVSVRGPRMILGTDLDRLITLTAVARPIDNEPFLVPVPSGAPMGSGSVLSGTALLTKSPSPFRAPGDADADGDDGALSSAAGAEPLTESLIITLRQRPWFTRGVLTALILLSIIALWAGVFLFGLGQVFAGDPLTKTAPASYFATAVTDQPAGVSQAAVAGSAPGAAAGAGATSAGATSAGATSAGAAPGAPAGAAPGSGTAGGATSAGGEPPAGALPKTGAMPAGLGGTISGTVTAATDGEPVGRILVEALRTKADGSTVVVSSAATQTDGTYQVAGLFPGSYALRFSAAGFVTVYHPAAPNQGSAQAVTVSSGAVTAGADAVIVGKPATITGSIDPGDTLDKVVATVSVRPLGGKNQGKTIASVRTNASGGYTIPKLPAPGSYQLVFTASGYQPTTVQTDVSGGAKRFEPSVLLSSGLGQISGTVTDGTSPLGGITVATTVDGTAVTTGTPTTGQVGHFVLGQLPTPATYVITFSGAGFGETTVVVDLGPGKVNNALKVVLAKGTGNVSGVLVDSTGKGIGGATVTVGGAADPQTTTTLTAGVVGSFSLSGLPSPGSYTLSFSLNGYADATVPVNLTGTAPVAPLRVVMVGALGKITGVVTGPGGAPMTGAAVVATDGKRSWPVTSTAGSGPVPNGGYVIDQLPAGVYTVTATSATGVARTAMVTVTPGTPATQNFPLSDSG
ncbi:Carboxypeptidase regulatory-like domain-containing protein [Nakamurella panacisegetis]|uniref:Carboxypeptidase regulatory-like domain-containing protein n=1 Tax=Nakamurella panacisegetis TaxID=1090615 RepID=A0A1H0JI65_9ACTN|nr:carboxypeptidase-like regulatory domain-containing protein [Nakamurella panacisegetis]SDO43210.1 Carboxypeptidase regulatory-like domain-containing protein [Nakamurella panacisegetis]